MDFKTEKTGEYIRSEVLAKGSDERERAMHALSCQYGTGSRETLAKLLLAALGSHSTASVKTEMAQTSGLLQASTAVCGKIAEPMQDGANDADYINKQAI